MPAMLSRPLALVLAAVTLVVGPGLATASPPGTPPRASTARSALVEVHATDPDGRTAVVSIDQPKVDVRRMLTALGEAAGWSVVIADGVEGRVSVFVRRAPVDEALQAILAQGGLAATVDGTLVTVVP